MLTFTEHDVAYENGKKNIHYIAAGPTSGPLIIFLHGWPAIAKTWRPQLESFASLGFRVIAPDMPGYGKSTSNKVITDYSQEVIAPGLCALLDATGRKEAIWAGHDWGAATLGAFVATHPHLCAGIVLMCVPYRSLEMGVEELLKYVNRDIYPEDEYPHGQWSYLLFYEQHFGKATACFDKNAPGALRAICARGDPATLGKPARTSKVLEDGGWFGGSPEPPSKDFVPPGASVLDSLPAEDVREFEEGMARTGFFGAGAYYMNHKANRKWLLENSKNGAVLEMPVLFVQANYDAVCDTYTTRLTEPMRALCKNLSFTAINSGHWVGGEKPEEVNAVIARWLIESLPSYWPGYWQNPLAKQAQVQM